MRHLVVPFVLTLLLTGNAASAQGDASRWPQFRGPDGLSLGGETTIPTDFGPGERVLWKAGVPAGHSSPIVVGERIFLTGYEHDRSVAVAIDRTNGSVLWRRTFGGEAHPRYMHDDAEPALPTMCTDGERVVAYFGAYGLVAFDLDGQVLWEKRLPHPGYGFGVGTSPILVEDIVVLSRDGAPEVAILGLSAEDGSEIWKIDRFEFGEAHGTPFLWRNADRDELVIGSSGRLCSYDPGTGELLWQYEGTTMFACTTATADEDTLYYAGWSTPNATGRSFWEGGFGRSFELTDAELADISIFFKRLDLDGDGIVSRAEAPESRAKDAFGFLDSNQNDSWELEEFEQLAGMAEGGQVSGANIMLAVARGGSGKLDEEHVRWTWKRGLPYVSSPLLYGTRIWLFKAGGLVTCLDKSSGEPVFARARLSDRSEYYMSPVGAAGKILIGSAEGTMYVLDAKADELQVTHQVELGDELFATPAVLDGKIYLRSKTTLTFLSRLAALIPHPREHQLTYHGVLAPASSWRDMIVPATPAVAGAWVVESHEVPVSGASARAPTDPSAAEPASPVSPRAPQRYRWAELMRRVFRLDVLRCPHCGGRRKLIALISAPPTVRRILNHLGLASEARPIAAARPPPQPAFGF